jgi:tetratricopeptide repeat protein
MREYLFGPDHAEAAASLNTLALLYVAQAQYGKAEPLYVRAIGTDEQTLGPDHADMAVLLESYAALLRQTQRNTNALTIQTRAKAIRAPYTKQSSSQ